MELFNVVVIFINQNVLIHDDLKEHILDTVPVSIKCKLKDKKIIYNKWKCFMQGREIKYRLVWNRGSLWSQVRLNKVELGHKEKLTLNLI